MPDSNDEITQLREHLQAITAARDGVVITDARLPDNPVVYVNHGFLHMTGYEETEVLGRNCRFLQGADTDPQSISILHNAVETQSSCRVTLLNYRKDGSPFWNECAVSAIRDAQSGHLTHYVGLHSDVSLQKKAEEVLVLRERAVAAASNGIVICDARLPDIPIVYCNRAFEKMTGYSESEIIGRNCRFLQGADTDETARNEIRDAIQNAHDSIVVIKNYRKNGPPFWNELTISPVRDTRGKVTHFIGVQTDITDFRRSEEENARLLIEVQSAAAQQRAFLRDILRSVTEGRLRLCETEDDLPEPLPLVGEPLALTMPSLRALRRVAQNAAINAGLGDERWQDFVAGAGEAAMNAVVHACNGTAEVRAEPDGVQVWVRDKGEGIALNSIHRATLEPGFSTAGSMGHGFWLMLKTCDACWLLTGPQGTTVVLQQGQTPPLAPWLQNLV